MTGRLTRGQDQIYWLDKLSTASVLRLAALMLSRRRARDHGIRYLLFTRGGRRLFSFLTPLFRIIGLRIRAEPRHYDLHELRLSNENSSAFGIDLEIDAERDRVGKAVSSKIDVASLLNDRLRRPYSPEKMRLFLRQLIAQDVYNSVLNLNVLRRLALLDAQGPSSTWVLLIERPPFYDAILREHDYSSEEVIETYGRPGSFLPFIRTALGLAKRLVDAMLYGQFYRPRGARRARHEPEPDTGRWRIAVVYTLGADLDTRSDIFWYPGSGLSPEQVLVYFSRQRFSASEAAIKHLDDLGLSWMDMSQWRPGGQGTQYLRHLLRIARMGLSLALHAVRGRSSLGWWLGRAAIDLEGRVAYWETFLREHRVAVHIHHSANTPYSVPLAFAAECAGAIDFGYQWSTSEFILSPRGRIVANHVLFCWGHLFADQIRANDMTPDSILIGGAVTGHLVERRANGAKRLRLHLLQDGKRYIICLLDSGFNRDIYVTSKIVEEFYEHVANWVIENPRVELLVKPRPRDAVMPPRIRRHIDRATATGRCVIENPGMSSIEAAMASDVAVGVGVSTAVLEAALAGVPAVHFDLPGMMAAYPGIEHGIGRFVFRDGDELYAAIEAHRQSGGKTSLGDHGDWLKKVDPFQDGKAAQRMGNYLRWSLESIEAGLNSQQAVAEATARYSREIGPQYVIRGPDPHPDPPPDEVQ